MASKVQKKGGRDVVSQVDQVEGHLIRPSVVVVVRLRPFKLKQTALELFKKSRDSHEWECSGKPSTSSHISPRQGFRL